MCIIPRLYSQLMRDHLQSSFRWDIVNPGKSAPFRFLPDIPLLRLGWRLSIYNTSTRTIPYTPG